MLLQFIEHDASCIIIYTFNIKYIDDTRLTLYKHYSGERRYTAIVWKIMVLCGVYIFL